MPTAITIPAPPDVTVRDLALFAAASPRPQFQVDSEKLKGLVAALEPGQCIPIHSEVLAVYDCIEATSHLIFLAAKAGN